MPEVSSHPPGAFCWPELATLDQNGAKAFYSALFGWDVMEVPIGPGETYSMFKSGGRDMAAAYSMRTEMRLQGVPPHWMSYVSVTDADAAVRKAQSLGGSVVTPALDVFESGRMAVLQDPTGAIFAVWQPKKHIGVGRVDEPGALCWTELMTGDPERARTFYTALFGWEAKSGAHAGLPYTELSNKGAPQAGMMPIPPDLKTVPPHWTPYFAVEDCDASAARARALGGRLYVEPTNIPNVGRFALVADPQGATFSIIRIAD
jgi:uncharacterized protein